VSAIAALPAIVLPIEKVDPFRSETEDLTELPIRHRERIRRFFGHYFGHYKALEQGKWSKILGWGDKTGAGAILMNSIERAEKG